MSLRRARSTTPDSVSSSGRPSTGLISILSLVLRGVGIGSRSGAMGDYSLRSW
jgi:hypothetical protein